ncbi:hypothetical protein ACFL21_00335 [Patescibacteria group bacterium]
MKNKNENENPQSLEDVEELLGPEVTKDVETLLVLDEWLEEVDSQNRELYDITLDLYKEVITTIVGKLRDRETPKQLKGKYVKLKKEIEARKSAFREKFPEFIAAEEELRKKQQFEKKAKPIFEKLNQSDAIPASESEQFTEYWNELGNDEQVAYLDRLKGALGQKESAKQLTHFRGALFELSRRAIVLRQDMESVEGETKPIYVEYFGYDETNPRFDKPPTKRFTPNQKNKQGDIESDVQGIEREGKTYVYETKAYPRRQFGAEYGDGESVRARNQALKYQKAIDDGLIAGATIELQGRLDYEFLNWAIGTVIEDRGAIPGVEIIYSFSLPSGQEYRFVLKSGEGEGLKFENDDAEYTLDDKIIIRGLAQAVRDKSIRDIIQDVNIEPDIDHPLVSKEHIENPDTITDVEGFNAYEDLRRTSILERLEEKALNPPTIDKVSAYDERATEDFVMKMVTEFQEMLAANPILREQKRAYVLEVEQYQEVVDFIMEEIRKIRTYETERMVSKEESKRRIERDIFEYQGPTEGYPLDIEHIMMDAIQNFTKTGEDQKPRSYDNVERFINLRDLREHLEDKDRSFIEIAVYDPVTEKFHSKNIQGRESSDEIDKAMFDHEKSIVLENLKRSENRLDRLLKRYTTLHQTGKDNRNEEQEQEYKNLQSQLGRYTPKLNKDLEDQMQRLEELEQEKKETLQPLQLAMRNIRGYIADLGIELDQKQARQEVIGKLRAVSAEFLDKVDNQKREILAIYKKIFARDWDTFTVREVQRKKANLMKLIYIVNAEGEVMIEEEKIRGDAVSGRAAHSELARGRNIFAAGELSFEKTEGEWGLTEINNGSGHYRPSHDTLDYATRVICDQYGTDPNDPRLRRKNCIFRGLDIDGLPLDYK